MSTRATAKPSSPARWAEPPVEHGPARARLATPWAPAFAFLLVPLLLFVPAAARGQSLLDLLAGIRQGGGWLDIAIERGRGSLVSATLPTAGLDVSGCLRVWGGHSGTWDIRVRDLQGTGRLETVALPDQPVRFAYATGALAQLDLKVQWSEPRDTTLVVWVGVGRGGGAGARDPCQPVYRP
jgi:hypothetical protein